MSESESNPSGDAGRPPGSWDGLPDVDWYQPEPQPQEPTTYGAPYYATPRQPMGRAPLVNKPKTNMVSAILVTLLCCLPFGIVAIVYAAQVDAKWHAGDWHGAERASRSAKNWAYAGVVTGIVFSVIYVLVVVSVESGTSTGRY